LSCGVGAVRWWKHHADPFPARSDGVTRPPSGARGSGPADAGGVGEARSVGGWAARTTRPVRRVGGGARPCCVGLPLLRRRRRGRLEVGALRASLAAIEKRDRGEARAQHTDATVSWPLLRRRRRGRLEVGALRASLAAIEKRDRGEARAQHTDATVSWPLLRRRRLGRLEVGALRASLAAIEKRDRGEARAQHTDATSRVRGMSLAGAGLLCGLVSGLGGPGAPGPGSGRSCPPGAASPGGRSRPGPCSPFPAKRPRTGRSPPASGRA